jgi:hypothetical protein
MKPKKIAAVGFDDAEGLASGHQIEDPQTDYYVYPKDITWKEMRQEIADLREHYEKVNLLENEMVIFDMLDKEGRLESPDIAFDLRNPSTIGEGRKVLFKWAGEVADLLLLTRDLSWNMNIVFTDKETAGPKGDRVVFI